MVDVDSLNIRGDGDFPPPAPPAIFCYVIFTSNSHTNPLEQAETNQIFCIFLNLVALVVQAFLEGRTEIFIFNEGKVSLKKECEGA